MNAYMNARYEKNIKLSYDSIYSIVDTHMITFVIPKMA